jgi:hypothetical protein
MGLNASQLAAGSFYLSAAIQMELLRHMASRVVIDHEGTIHLCLRSPFSYLQDITNRILRNGEAEENQDCSKKKTGEDLFTSFPRTACSLTALCCGKDKSQSEHQNSFNPTDFLRNIAFPQRAKFTRFSNIDSNLAFR